MISIFFKIYDSFDLWEINPGRLTRGPVARGRTLSGIFCLPGSFGSEILLRLTRTRSAMTNDAVDSVG